MLSLVFLLLMFVCVLFFVVVVCVLFLFGVNKFSLRFVCAINFKMESNIRFLKHIEYFVYFSSHAEAAKSNWIIIFDYNVFSYDKSR